MQYRVLQGEADRASLIDGKQPAELPNTPDESFIKAVAENVAPRRRHGALPEIRLPERERWPGHRHGPRGRGRGRQGQALQDKISRGPAADFGKAVADALAAADANPKDVYKIRLEPVSAPEFGFEIEMFNTDVFKGRIPMN